MAEVCLYVELALDSHIGPRAKAIGPIWLPQCQYDLEAHLGHTITCISGSMLLTAITSEGKIGKKLNITCWHLPILWLSPY